VYVFDKVHNAELGGVVGYLYATGEMLAKPHDGSEETQLRVEAEGTRSVRRCQGGLMVLKCSHDVERGPSEFGTL
jgi:hypothetical protein